MRSAFIDELVALARANSNIVLMVGDIGFSVVEPFRDEFPDRFINGGVAEQNMMGVAAGLASEGCHVFVYSIANFPTFRCAEQIRNDIAYHNLPVTVVAVGGGVAYGNLGYSHHAIQDYALLRSMPNMLISAPGDSMEVRGVLRYLTNNPQPSYLRLGKNFENYHKSVPALKPGIWQPIWTNPSKKDGGAILVTGQALQIMHRSPQLLLENSSLYSLPLWGMDCKKMQAAQLEKYRLVSTIEDHLVDGGFGSWLLESLNAYAPLQTVKVKICAFDSQVSDFVAEQKILEDKFLKLNAQ